MSRTPAPKQGESENGAPALPCGWVWTTVGEIALNFDGKRVPIKAEDRDKRPGSFPYYGASGVIDEIDDFIFDGKYLLVAEDGANLLSRATPIAFTVEGQFWVNNHAHVLQLREQMPLGYLQWFLNGNSLQFYVTGTAQPKLNQVNLNRIEIPLAPLNEQQRIVEKIEQLFSELDAGVAALERARANLKRYRASVLKAAVDGSLTAQWRSEHPDAEPASKLLERILAERRRKWESNQLAKFKASGKEPPKNWRAKYVEPEPPDTANLPELPANWCWASMEQLGSVQLGRQRSPKNRSRNHPTKYLRAANITEDGLDLDDVLDMEFLPAEFPNFCLASGDILVSEASGSPDQVGKPAVWESQIGRCCFQNTLIRLRPIGISSHYLLVALRHCYFNRQFARLATGVGINHLSATKFARVAIPLAPVVEHPAIVEMVDSAWTTIANTRDLLAAMKKRAARLRQSLLKHAFEGKLVEQNAADEPACELLARIKAQTDELDRQNGRTARRSAKGIRFRQGAVVSYIIDALGSNKDFGRTQLEKALHLTQSHLQVDLGLEFKREAAGPFDEVIYKIESLARKQGWFTTRGGKHGRATYEPGPHIAERCKAAVAILGEHKSDLNTLLGHFTKMNTEQTELFATTYAAWNDILLDGRTANDESIIAEVRAWHATKQRFDGRRILKWIDWMRKHCYVPTGRGEHTLARIKEKPNRKSTQ